jgi:glycolate oxidase FAD binding subunit
VNGAGILEYEPGDQTVIVCGAMPLDALAPVLAEHGQRLSLDPPGSPTLERCVLDDLSGPLRHRFGTMRDLVLGVTVCLRDGTRASSGGKVVKNVAGYDLGKLFSGSRGRLGLIARLALRLHARPAAARSVLVEGDDPRARWRELHHAQLSPAAVDYLPPGRLMLLFEGSQQGVAAQVDACPGVVCEHTVWAESAERQERAQGREPFAWQECLLGRPGAGVAYTAEPSERSWSPLAERVRASFDPEGSLR